MKGQKFIDLSTNNIVEVIDSFEDIAVLDGNTKIRTSRLLDTRFYEPHIDPEKFIKSNQHLDDFVNKLRQIPIENIKESLDTLPRISEIDTPAILPYDPEEEKRELMRKYNIKEQNSDIIRQQEAFSKILNETTTTIEVEREENRKTDQRQDDPMINMFRNCKRTLDFKLDLSLDEKIPRIEFIQMMEDSYNISIIDYLAEEFTNKIFNDPSEIRNRIKEEIVKIVYPKKTTSRKPRVKKDSTKISKSPKKNSDVENTSDDIKN